MNRPNSCPGPHDRIQPPRIYSDLAYHQRSEDWHGRELLTQLQVWHGTFDVEFKLDVPETALCVDDLPVSVLGHFRTGHNGFGLKGEIAINARYLLTRPWWRVLGTLLHEGLHAWQEAHGTPSRIDHHNLEFRRRAAELGLLVDRQGVTDYLLQSPFIELLRSRGVETPEASEDEGSVDAPGQRAPRVIAADARVKGKSKLIKWSCGCQNVWHARPELRALCLTCGKPFQRVN